MSPYACVLIFPIFEESFSEEARIHLEQQRKIRIYVLPHPFPSPCPPLKVMPLGECMMLSGDGMMNRILIDMDLYE